MLTRFPELYRMLVGPVTAPKPTADQRWKDAVAEAKAAKERRDTRGYHQACKAAAEAAQDALRVDVRV